MIHEDKEDYTTDTTEKDSMNHEDSADTETGQLFCCILTLTQHMHGTWQQHTIGYRRNLSTNDTKQAQDKFSLV